MIARFRPTFSYSQIFTAISRFEKDTSLLVERLQGRYKTKNILLFGSARSAIYSLLTALGQKGEVISPAYNCIVVPDAVRYAGYRNHFVDISLDDYNMDLPRVANAVNANSKVIMATHQFGLPCDIVGLKSVAVKKGLFLFEDAAAAMGATVGNREVGTFGDASVISFQYTKVISGMEGAALIVKNNKLFDNVASVAMPTSRTNSILTFARALGLKTVTTPLIYGVFFPVWSKVRGAYTGAEEKIEEMPTDYLASITNFSASLINSQLEGLTANVSKRRKFAEHYLARLGDASTIELPKPIKGSSAAWTRFPVRVKHKERFFRKLADSGVDLAWTFSYSCPIEYGFESVFANSAQAAKEVLNLPIYPGLQDWEIEKVITLVKQNGK